jgi:hypothetical protein
MNFQTLNKPVLDIEKTYLHNSLTNHLYVLYYLYKEWASADVNSVHVGKFLCAVPRPQGTNSTVNPFDQLLDNASIRQ